MLKNRRKILQMSQKSLAKKLGVTQSYLSKIESGKFNNINIELINKLSIELKLNPKEIFDYFYNLYLESHFK